MFMFMCTLHVHVQVLVDAHVRYFTQHNRNTCKQIRLLTIFLRTVHQLYTNVCYTHVHVHLLRGMKFTELNLTIDKFD